MLVSAWALLVCGLLVRAMTSALVGNDGALSIVVVPRVLDVNLAGVHELSLLPGVGRVRADAIVLERIRNGAFRSLADLERVDGLGPATIHAIAPFVANVASPSVPARR